MTHQARLRYSFGNMRKPFAEYSSLVNRISEELYSQQGSLLQRYCRQRIGTANGLGIIGEYGSAEPGKTAKRGA
jgi:hypothetical protein